VNNHERVIDQPSDACAPSYHFIDFGELNVLGAHQSFVLQKANLIPGGNDSLVYTTLSGTVGMLVPFTSHEDHDFFQVRMVVL
jgi:hypothetical protein